MSTVQQASGWDFHKGSSDSDEVMIMRSLSEPLCGRSRRQVPVALVANGGFRLPLTPRSGPL